MAIDTTSVTVTYRVLPDGPLVAACAVDLGPDGAPRYAPHAFPGLVVGGGHPLASFLDEASLAALEGGAELRVWAGTPRTLALREGIWWAEGRPLAPFAALGLEGAMDADQKAWVRLARAARARP